MYEKKLNDPPMKYTLFYRNIVFFLKQMKLFSNEIEMIYFSFYSASI